MKWAPTSLLMLGVFVSLLFGLNRISIAQNPIAKPVKRAVRKIAKKSSHPAAKEKEILSQLTKGKEQAKPKVTLPKPKSEIVPLTLLKQRFLLKEDPELKNWVFYSADKEVPRDKTWIKRTNGDPNEPVLFCVGKPFGYLRTQQKYKDFEFGFEWKYQNAPNGNSGVLVHTSGEDKIWPQAIQIQLHVQKAGSIFPSGGGKTDNTVSIQDETLDCTKWNVCLITSKDGKVTVTINEKKMGEVTGCNPNAGTIGFQSEGAGVYFRKIWIRSEAKEKRTREAKGDKKDSRDC